MKASFSPITYVLVILDANGQKINSSVSIKGESGTHDLAKSILRITVNAATVDIYPFIKGIPHDTFHPLTSVSLDDPDMEAGDD